MSVLKELQYELDGFVFGRGTPYTVATSQFDSPTIDSQDTDLPRGNGIRFGQDRRRGRTITFDMNILTNGSALDELEGLTTAWRDNDIASTPGKMSILRMRRDNRTRRVYGRPRKFAATTGTTLSGWIPVTSTFVTSDDLFYSDEETTVSTYIVPPASGGLLLPAVAPFILSDPGTGQGQFTVAGSVPTPLMIRIYGPITDPSVEFIGSFIIGLSGTLASDDYVDIDSRDHTAITRFGKNWAGKFQYGSPSLSDIVVSPGAHTVVLRGTDQTGTAALNLSWRNAYTSF